MNKINYPAMLLLAGLLSLVIATGAIADTNDAAKQRERWKKQATSHYQQRVNLFKEENRQLKKNVVLLGDSITLGFNVEKYFPNKHVINRGIGGDVIGMKNDPLGPGVRGLMQRLDVSVFDCCTTHIFLLIGINDLAGGRKVEQMINGYRNLLAALRDQSPEITIWVQSLLPTRARFAKLNPDIRRFNDMLRNLASDLSCHYLDLHALYVDDNGELKEDLTHDGLHLKPDAYKPWAELINKKMHWSPN